MQDRSKRNRLSFPGVPGEGPHRGPELFRINLEASQRGHPKHADVIAHRNDGIQAGKQVARLAGIGNVEPLDDKRNLSLGQFLHDFIAVGVLAVEKSEIAPPATQPALRFAEHSHHVGGLGLFSCIGDDLHASTVHRRTFAGGVSFAHRFERLARVSQRVAHVVSKGRRIAFNQLEGTAENWRGGPPISLQNYRLGRWKVMPEQLKCSTRRPAEAVDALIGIANRENIGLRPGKRREKLYLGEVHVLEFIHQNEAGPAPLLGQKIRVRLQQRVCARDHMAEGSEIFLRQPAFRERKHPCNFLATPEHLSRFKLHFRFDDAWDGQFATLQTSHILGVFLGRD